MKVIRQPIFIQNGSRISPHDRADDPLHRVRFFPPACRRLTGDSFRDYFFHVAFLHLERRGLRQLPFPYRPICNVLQRVKIFVRLRNRVCRFAPLFECQHRMDALALSAVKPDHGALFHSLYAHKRRFNVFRIDVHPRCRHNHIFLARLYRQITACINRPHVSCL